MKENVILDKTYAFGLKIVKLYKQIIKMDVERALCVQLLRSGTSVGANVEEAIGGSSKRDFAHKMQIAYKEARETRYWLRLLKDSESLNEMTAFELIAECEEILRILTAILNSLKKKDQ